MAWPKGETPRVAQAEVSLAPGQQVGRWQVVELLGTGGFGSVFHVIDVRDGNVGALKIMHRHLLDSGAQVARFNREIQSLSSIHHPSVLDILDIGVAEDGRPFFVMELLSGESLSTLLARRHRLSASEVAAILEPICAALDIAHRHRIVHRDLKASNVFLRRRDGGVRAVLLDFGIAKVLGAPGDDLTRSGVTLGTPACMAPEQIRGQAVDSRTDVYGLGILTFHMLTGVLPFGKGADVTRLLYLHVHGARPLPSAYAPVPAAVDEVVTRAMAQNPDDRYSRASDFAAAFRTAIPTDAREVGLAAPATGGGAALGLHVAVRLDESVADDPDDEILDDVETVLTLATRHCQQSHFEKVCQTSSSMLWARALGSDSIQKGEIEKMIVLERVLATRPARDPRVHVTLMMHVDSVALCEGRITGGPLANVSNWQADQALGGLLVSGEACRYLDETHVEPVSGTRWLRLKR